MAVANSTVVIPMTSQDGATVLLQLGLDGSVYSVGSNIWFPIGSSSVSGGTVSGSYTFTGGLKSDANGIVVIDPDRAVEALNYANIQLSKKLIPVVDYVQGSGITISGNTISANIGTAPGNIVSVGADGKIALELLPPQQGGDLEYTPGSGIDITNNVISIKTGIEPGMVPAVDITGYLPKSVIPQLLEAGNGIKIEGNTVSVTGSTDIWEDLRG